MISATPRGEAAPGGAPDTATPAPGLPATSAGNLHVLSTSVSRRWVMIAVGVAFLVGGRTASLVPLPIAAIWGIAAALVAANLAFGLLASDELYRPWVLFAALAFDVLYAGGLVALFGHGGMIVALFVAILPYATGQLRLPGDLLVAGGGLVYLAATVVHAWVVAPSPAGAGPLIPPAAYLEAIAFVLTAGFLRRSRHRLVARIGVTRDMLQRAAQGALDVRAPASEPDDFGVLERSLNQTLDDIGAAIAAVQRESHEVSALADVMSASVQAMVSASEAVASTAATLADDMDKQRSRAEEGQDRSNEAAGEAAGLRDRAETVAKGARRLVDAAEGGRERVLRASETLLAIGEDVRTTASTVEVLSNMSERVGSFAHNIVRIARQTHVLALNAAIEAAHSETEREGFSAVAEEVRGLAAQADRSAREAAEIIDDLQSRIGAVARAMSAGQEQVRDVGVVAGEAQAALDELVTGAADTTELIAATADISRSQASRMSDLASQMSEIARVSADSSVQATGAAGALARQRATLEDLNAISRQLAGLADRLRSSVGRFTVGGSAPG